ncbi:hypothetical protein MUSASHINO07_05570 [Gemella sp. Musashino-2025]
MVYFLRYNQEKTILKYLKYIFIYARIDKYVKIHNLIEWENENFKRSKTTSRKINRRFYRG